MVYYSSLNKIKETHDNIRKIKEIEKKTDLQLWRLKYLNKKQIMRCETLWLVSQRDILSQAGT